MVSPIEHQVEDLKLQRAAVRGKQLRKKRAELHCSRAEASALAVGSALAPAPPDNMRARRYVGAASMLNIQSGSANCRADVHAKHSAHSRTRTCCTKKLVGSASLLLEEEVGFSDAATFGQAGQFITKVDGGEVVEHEKQSCSDAAGYSAKMLLFQGNSSTGHWPALIGQSKREKHRVVQQAWPCKRTDVSEGLAHLEQAEQAEKSEAVDEGQLAVSSMVQDDPDLDDEWEIIPETYSVHLRRNTPPRARSWLRS